MKGLIIGLYDESEKYKERLADIITRNETGICEMICYDDRPSILKALEQGKISIALVSVAESNKDLYEKEQSLINKNIEKIIVLDDGSYQGKARKIWKYQSGEKIRKELLRHIADDENTDVGIINQRKSETHVIGVFSPSQRNIQTVISYMLANELKGKNLYVGLLPFEGINEECETNNINDLTNLLYVLNGKEERLQLQLESMLTYKNEIEILPPVFSFEDLKSIEKETWLKLIESIKNLGKYEHIILNLSECVQGILDVLRLCEKVYTPVKAEESNSMQMNQYKLLLKNLEYEDVLDKTFVVDIPAAVNEEKLQNQELRKIIRNTGFI